MAKVQKSLLIHEDLKKLADAVESRTGASFTRIVAAALLKYMLDRPKADAVWMELAMDLERGDVTLPRLPQRLYHWLAECARREEAHGKQPPISSRTYTHVAENWRRQVHKADDPMQLLIDSVLAPEPDLERIVVRDETDEEFCDDPDVEPA